MEIPSVRLSVAFFQLLLSFSSFFDLPRPSVTFAFVQFVSFRSSCDLPYLFLSVFDDGEKIADSDRMDDDDQIGRYLATEFFRKSYGRSKLLRRLVGVAAIGDNTANGKILPLLPVRAPIS
jgi:hypothetical protein